MRYSANRVSRLTGVSIYKIRKWLADGDIQELTPESVEFQQRREHLLRRDKVTAEELCRLAPTDMATLQRMIDVGAILPFADGTYYPADWLAAKPHRFGVLPRHIHYVPVRPRRHGASHRSMTADVFWEFVERRREYTPGLEAEHNGECSGKVVTPDGFFYGDDYRITSTHKTVDVVTVTANAPLYAPDVETSSVGLCVRATAHIAVFPNHVIVNLEVLDDYGVPVRGHGVYSGHNKLIAFQRALKSIGFHAEPLGSLDEELKRLQEWLNSAAE